MWNTFRSTAEFAPGTPWLLRFFDQIRFFPVTSDELLDIRDGFPRGRYSLRIEESEFRLRDYHAFLKSIEADASEFKARQQQAFEAERDRWGAAGQADFAEPPDALRASRTELETPEGCKPLRSPIGASVWTIGVEMGQRVEAGQKLLVLEAMKTEIAVVAPSAGTVEKLHCAPGSLVSSGQVLLAFRPEAGQ
jgi:urea carboxylase